MHKRLMSFFFNNCKYLCNRGDFERLLGLNKAIEKVTYVFVFLVTYSGNFSCRLYVFINTTLLTNFWVKHKIVKQPGTSHSHRKMFLAAGVFKSDFQLMKCRVGCVLHAN